VKQIVTELFKSVFSIRDKEVRIEGGRREYYKAEQHRGFAVAVTSRHLLTAFHCVKPYDNPCVFTQPEQGIRIESGFTLVDSHPEADLALIELPQELVFYRPVVSIRNTPRFSQRLILVNHFNGIPQAQRVSKCLLTLQDSDYIPNDYVESYKMPVRAVGGYSGSPLFTEDGMVASVAVKVNTKRQDRVEAISGFMKAVGFNPLDIPFEAVNPKDVARFLTECSV